MPQRPSRSVYLVSALTLAVHAEGAAAAHEPPLPSGSHWAFQPPERSPVPAVRDETWPKTDLDRFVLHKLEEDGLAPSPVADRRTLIRRATFDLTGLPPAAEDEDAFLADETKDAFSKVVERLLESPRYGERWGRHWLDVARYSDTKGYVYAREERFFVHAHTYRDWVIRAFNSDLPYDRFLLLQIAADQLVPPGSPDLAAMGFLTGGRRFLGVTHDIIDDRIDVVTRGTMALTVQCARCHDHKYDPIPTRDYYSMYGVFHACTERLVRIQSEQPSADDESWQKEHEQRANKLTDTMKQRREEAEARLRGRVADYLLAQLDPGLCREEGFDQLLTAEDLIPASIRHWRDFLFANRDEFHPVLAPWHALARLQSEDFEAAAAKELQSLCDRHGAGLNVLVAAEFSVPPASLHEAAERYGRLFADVERRWVAEGDAARNAGSTPPRTLPDPAAEALRRFLYDPRSPTTVPETAIVNNEQFFPTSVCEELWKLQGEVDRWNISSGGSPPHALILVDREPEGSPRVFERGSPAQKGAEVPRQFLEVVAGMDQKPFQRGSGRLELAQAIVSAGNPLTARVMANRIWQHHFGAGLVRTVSDFGLRAEPPSHKELLDWLALHFIADGWSVKKLHRRIMGSATYQQSSNVRDNEETEVAQTRGSRLDAETLDPERRLLWSFPRRRLDFEEIRDSMLAASGELDATIGGKPVELLEAVSTRRSIYGLVDRQFLPGTFRVFDFANPDFHCPERHATTVPQQALFFLNHPFVAGRARALARVTEVSGSPPEARVKRIYRRVFQRSPTLREAIAALSFIAEARGESPPLPPRHVESSWQYGYAEYDSTRKQTSSFQPLPHFSGDAWQGAEAWPDASLGWARLTADGGHPGNDLQHAVVRRWVAPLDTVVSIAGDIVHQPDPGDGIRAFLVSSRHGELRSAEVHHAAADMSADSVEVKQGDTLDFIVDLRADLNSDQFLWAPVITVADSPSPAGTAPARTWDARAEFAGPPPPWIPPLDPWQQLAQVLLLTNEFSFID